MIVIRLDTHHVDMSHLVVKIRVKSPEVSEVDRIYSCFGIAEGGAAGNWDLAWETSDSCRFMLRVRPVEWVLNQAVVSKE